MPALNLADAVATGDRRAALEALRDYCTEVLEDRPAGIAIGPIVNQLRLVLAELETLPDGKVSKVDDLAAKRADRQAAARKPAASGQ